MKRAIPILVLSCFWFANPIYLYSQKTTIELSFTAQNGGHYVVMDSIVIENLTQGADTTLYAPDTVLFLNNVAGVEINEKDDNNAFVVLQNRPNPFSEMTDFNIFVWEKDDIKIVVRDILGRELVDYESILNRGNHSFTFYPDENTYYFLTVTGKQKSESIKMLNLCSDHPVKSGKCRIVYNGIRYEESLLKFRESINGFVYSFGDELRFTSYTDVEKVQFTGSPTGNESYIFEFEGWTPCPGMSVVDDIDGNSYNTVQIGNQCWMKENLKTTTYSNGSPIPNVTDVNLWNSMTTGAYVWYDNDIGWKNLYGGLYNWYAAVDANAICPEGWHLPSYEEWEELDDFLGGSVYDRGNMLKSCWQVNSPIGDDCDRVKHPRWDEDVFNNNYGTDDYGFSALPSGYLGLGSFGEIGEGCAWWSAKELTTEMAYSCRLSYYGGNIDIYYGSKQVGYSIRCLKD